MCSDYHKMAPILAKDNLRFFAKSREELMNLKNGLAQLTYSSPTLRDTGPFEQAKAFFLKCEEQATQNGLLLNDVALIREFHKADELFRYAFYLIMKVQRRSSGLSIDDEQWGTLFTQEVERQTRAIDFLLDANEMGEYAGAQSHIVFGQSGYSRSSSINFRYILSDVDKSYKKTCLGGRDARRLRENSVDVIVTDPPYGFNTNENPTHLAKLYSEAIPALVNALRSEGQLVLALPDWSHSGRQILAFTYKEFVTHQVLIAADKRGWEVIRSATPTTRERDLFRAPFYWESDRALRRAILHFRFRDKAVLLAESDSTQASPHRKGGQSL